MKEIKELTAVFGGSLCEHCAEELRELENLK